MVYTICEGYPGDFQQAEIDKKKMRRVIKNKCDERRNISFLKDVNTSKRFEEKVIKLVDVGATNLWRHFKD